MLFRNFDIFRSSDLSLALVVCLTTALFVLGVDFQPLSRTCGGTQRNGEPCLDTPWTYRGNTYNAGKGTCILEDHSEWWCYTRKDLSAWGNCSCGQFGMYVVYHFSHTNRTPHSNITTQVRSSRTCHHVETSQDWSLRLRVESSGKMSMVDQEIRW